MWRSVKYAAHLTRGQMLEKAKAHWARFGDSTVHELDLPQEEGKEEQKPYSLRRLVSKDDYNLEGSLQENCIKENFSYNKAADIFSVRDENNLPVASMRMRRRKTDDYQNSSNASADGARRNFDFHNTGNDVLVVDEAVQKGNAQIDKYIRPALTAMVAYAKKHNIPKIAYGGGQHVSGSRTAPVDVSEVERLLNTEKEAPDYLYVSHLKGLRKADGSLPTNVTLTRTNYHDGLEPITVRESQDDSRVVNGQLAATFTVRDENDETETIHYNRSDFYDTVRVPFSTRRFERMGGLVNDVSSMFGLVRNPKEGWKFRDHVTELKPSLLNDVVPTEPSDTAKLRPITQPAFPEDKRVQVSTIGTYGVQVANATVADASSNKNATIKSDKVHSVMFRLPVPGYGSSRSTLQDYAAVYTDSNGEIGKDDVDINFNEPIYVATPSTLRDHPNLFTPEGLNVQMLYGEHRYGALKPERSHFVGSQKNDIWEVDVSKLSPEMLGRLSQKWHTKGGYRSFDAVDLADTGLIPYEALSIASQSEQNKRKPLPKLERTCLTCSSTWTDEEHKGHESALRNTSKLPELPVPTNFTGQMPVLSPDDVDALNAGRIPDSVRQAAGNVMSGRIKAPIFSRQHGGDPVKAPIVEGVKSFVSVAYNPDQVVEAQPETRGYYNYSDYASQTPPTSREYTAQPNLANEDLDVEVHNWQAPDAMPEKYYFPVPADMRRKGTVYTENGIDFNAIASPPYPNGHLKTPRTSIDGLETLTSNHDIWSVDTSHPSVRSRMSFNPQNRTWLFNHASQPLPYDALTIERKGDDDINPHIRQFFSKVAQYLTDGETSGGWVSEYWGQGGSVSAPTTADPNEVAIDPQTGKRKRPNGSLWTTIGDNGIDNPEYIRQLEEDPKFKNILRGWQGLKNLFSPNTPGINTYSSVLSEELRRRNNCIPCTRIVSSVVGVPTVDRSNMTHNTDSPIHKMLNEKRLATRQKRGWKSVTANEEFILAGDFDPVVVVPVANESWKRTFSVHSPNSFLRLIEAASKRQERLQERDEALSWVNDNQQGAPYTPAAETVYELPNGFTVKRLKTFGDLGYEGYMMHHCLKEDFVGEECGACDGTGRCYECDGKGSWNCDTCDTTGKENCETCGGLGKGRGEKSNGFLRLPKNLFTSDKCPDCDEGKVSCSACNGKGRRECWDCGDSNVGQCSSCEGNGNSEPKDANEEFDPYSLNRAEDQPYSLRNAEDIPVMTWWEREGDGDLSIESVYGRGNSIPKPKYQHMMLDYIHRYHFNEDPAEQEMRFPQLDGHRIVSVDWAGYTKNYTPEDTKSILRGENEIPDHLYMHHDHYPCVWEKTIDKDCRERPDFATKLYPLDENSASTQVNNWIIRSKDEDDPVTAPSVYRIDTKDLKPGNLIYEPSSNAWTLRKRNDIPSELFIPVRSKQELTPSAYERLAEGFKSVEAASRRQERLKQKEEALKWVSTERPSGSPEYVPAAETVHELSDGFSIKKLKTFGDLGYEGQMMNHCIKTDYTATCEECNGGQCGPCDGDGREECYECEGEGTKEQECKTCEGREVEECPTCEGEGGFECASCKGENEDCATCEGTGEKACTECEGEGEIACTNDKCDGGEEMVDCEECYGEGDLECNECNGTGVCNECNGEPNTVKNPNERFDPQALSSARSQPYSLRNEDDIPAVTFCQSGSEEPRLTDVYGRGDTEPKPEHQMRILRYVHENLFGAGDPATDPNPESKGPKRVTVSWGRGEIRSYTPTNTAAILSGRVEKPDTFYLSTYASSPSDDMEHIPSVTGIGGRHFYSNPFGWANKATEKYMKEGHLKIYKVNAADIEPKHMVFNPSFGGWNVRVKKALEHRPDAFKPLTFDEYKQDLGDSYLPKGD